MVLKIVQKSIFVLMALVAGAKSTYAQSSLPYNYLPPGSTPGAAIIHLPQPQESNTETTPEIHTQSNDSGGASPSIKMKRPGRALLSTKDVEFNYSLILLGVKQESAYDNYDILSFRLYSIMKYQIVSDLLLWVEPYLLFRTGADQSPDGNSHNGTILIAKDASLIWTPIKWWQLRGGLLDQNFQHSFMLLEDQAFPGLRTTFYLGDVGGTRALGGSLTAEHSILTFSSNTTTTNQIERVPTLSSGTSEAHYLFNSRDQIKFSLGYWQYDNLPSSVAALGLLNGNTVRRTSDSFSEFAYQYKGYEGRTRLELGLGRLDLNLYSEALINTAAPEGLNTAWSVGNELVFRGAQNRKYGFNSEYFHVEPDAAVSVYNAFEFDRSNRNGFAVIPYFKFGKKPSKVSFRYVSTSLIYKNAAQSDITQIRLRWETDYDIL